MSDEYLNFLARKRIVDPPFDVAYLRSILIYDMETGIFNWRHRSDMPKEWNTKYAGKIAGTDDRHGYSQICINYKLYRAHRLAWIWVTGDWPTQDIDHIDMNGFNNSFGNLRHATRSQNNCNTTKRTTNTSGFKGVTFDKNENKWVAQISINKKHKMLGRFATRELAHAAYCVASTKLHGEFGRHS